MVTAVLSVLSIIVKLTREIQQITNLIITAQREGRDLTVAELELINDKYNDSFISLDEAIAKKKTDAG